jgi:hyaluronan synthase
MTAMSRADIESDAGEVVIDLRVPPAPPETGPVSAVPVRRFLWLTLVAFIVGVLVVHAVLVLDGGGLGRATAAYAVIAIAYLVSRFALASLYRSPKTLGHTPSLAIIVPAFNEGSVVRRTIHACRDVDYPADKLEVICVNDGSADDTWDHMVAAAAEHPEGSVQCIDLGANKGKRAAMTAGIRATSAEILVFVDSDSHPGRHAIRHLVQPLADPKVGAVSGLTHVRNAETNLLTRMQAVRYYISFQLMKRAESVLGAVACCSGCFAAYRRSAVVEVLDDWERQRFLGVDCTYGDDRSLSNLLIRKGWRTCYAATAEAWTDAPERYSKFFRQQLRWKKSWSRENLLLLLHVWRSRPLAFPFIVMGTVTSLLSPVILLLNLVVSPFITGDFPVEYFVGLYLATVAYAGLYRALRADALWRHAFSSTVFYLFLSFQLFWAIARLRDSSWGTRG